MNMRLEAREGMGATLPVTRLELSSVRPGERLLKRLVPWKPFTTLVRESALLRTEYWDGHEARVVLLVNGNPQEGYGLSSNLADAYQQAYEAATKVVISEKV